MIAPPKLYTEAAEYLERERKAASKSEYYAGEIRLKKPRLTTGAISLAYTAAFLRLPSTFSSTRAGWRLKYDAKKLAGGYSCRKPITRMKLLRWKALTLSIRDIYELTEGIV